MIEIINYSESMEKEWVLLRARIVARSHTWDFVERVKVKYENPSIELILKNKGELIGYIDAEFEMVPGAFCWENQTCGAVVQEFGVSPEFQDKGYGKMLLEALKQKLLAKKITRVEFWTKDPKSISFYQHLKFREIFCHQHYRVSPDKIAILKDQKLWKPIYAYMIKSTNESVIDAIKDAPLEPHTCYGFEWLF
jgi:ribosomal protein S18 acetylase RimI-like enzyme